MKKTLQLLAGIGILLSAIAVTAADSNPPQDPPMQCPADPQTCQMICQVFPAAPWCKSN